MRRSVTTDRRSLESGNVPYPRLADIIIRGLRRHYERELAAKKETKRA